MVTVIAYGTAIEYPDIPSKLDASFYVSCCAISLILAGIIIHGIGAKNSEWTWSWKTI